MDSVFDTDNRYLGKLCVYNHDYNGTGQSLRIIANNRCVECNRITQRKNREKNREKRKEYDRLYSLNNRERLRANARQRYKTAILKRLALCS